MICKLIKRVFGRAKKQSIATARYPAKIIGASTVTEDVLVIYNYINSKRQRHNIDPLLLEAGLQEVAQLRLNEIKIHLRHKPESDKHSSILKAKGLLLYSENIGYAGSPDGLSQSWYKSPDHRPQILNPHFRYTGIAGELVGHLYFGVQVFGR